MTMNGVECFDPESGVWTEMADIPEPRIYHSFVSYGNNLILLGGCSNGRTWNNAAMELDPHKEKNGIWLPLPKMKYLWAACTGVAIDKEIFIFGGNDETYTSTNKVQIYNEEYWHDGPSLPYSCLFAAAMVIPQHLADHLYSSR